MKTLPLFLTLLHTLEMMQRMVKACYDKCAGTSVSRNIRVFVMLRGKRCYSIVYKRRHRSLLIFDVFNQGDKLDSREQSCMAMCQDRYLEARAQVQETLMKRQGSM